MIEIKNLNFMYKNTSEKILDDMSLKFSSGKVNVIIGHNGSGKTTLLDILSGAINRPSEVYNAPPQKDIVYQLQGVLFPLSLKGKDYVRIYINTDHKKKSNNDLYNTLLEECINDRERYMLKKLWHLPFGAMSVGERRWLTTISICLLDRALYIFDEPTSGVDPEARVNILRRIDKLSSIDDKLIVLTTHTLHEFKFIKCQLYVMSEGKIVFEGSYDDFLKNARTDNPDKAFEIIINRREH
ncbi:AAA family ATPase [Evansella cellulosilytica]|uniref:ABC transporter related protein n=1 Tax=Evansella cellulosilytica (strain ATCC 21833 / DSM 2522 / FERM P-1141 / JCM 9156 / N-4) TaxID=649639 RepID=E6TR52_EVAC2|nr:AAA family ATPase [Evansella cellulosilytica]ADU29428.1 ABC transporter related protein [Evansella cellulosilytica DSM 2522]